MDNQLRKFERKKEHYPSFFNRFNDDFFTNFFEDNIPAVNVKETKKDFRLELSVPGFDKEDFKIEIDKNVLKISAQKECGKDEKDEEEKVWRQEFYSSSFTRSFVLPENIDTEHIAAKEKAGILKITLPKMDKAPEDKIKKIEIK